MGLEDLHKPVSEVVKLSPLKMDHAVVRATVERVASALELQIDLIAERRRRLTVEMHVTLTGDPYRIADFRSMIRGQREDSYDWFDAIGGMASAVAREAAEKFGW